MLCWEVDDVTFDCITPEYEVTINAHLNVGICSNFMSLEEVQSKQTPNHVTKDRVSVNTVASLS